MIKILQIIGTRPQYEKLIRFDNDHVIDTGQHYSKELCYDKNIINLTLNWVNIKNCIQRLKIIIKKLKPKLIIVYGDTFSTFAGAGAAKQTKIELCHIEAGVRTKNKTIENRIRERVDNMSDYLLCSSKYTYENCKLMFRNKSIWFTGDIMRDNFLDLWQQIRKAKYNILTFHRRENLKRINDTFNYLRNKGIIRFYIHPHTKKYIQDNNIEIPKNIKLYKPISNKEMLKIILRAKKIYTDSGGLIKEAFWAGIKFEFLGVNPWEGEINIFGNDVRKNIEKVIKEIIK